MTFPKLFVPSLSRPTEEYRSFFLLTIIPIYFKIMVLSHYLSKGQNLIPTCLNLLTSSFLLSACPGWWEWARLLDRVLPCPPSPAWRRGTKISPYKFRTFLIMPSLLPFSNHSREGGGEYSWMVPSLS
jgi:hypothetical protein